MDAKPLARTAEEKSSLSAGALEEAQMEENITAQIRKIRLEIAKLERQMDELLGLNAGPRKPKREMLSREQAKQLFADARRRHNEHIPA